MLFLYIKMVNRYCQKHKEKFRKEARERYQNLSEEDKEKKGEKKAPGRYQNLPEEKNDISIVSIIVNVIRTFLKNKEKRKLSI